MAVPDPFEGSSTSEGLPEVWWPDYSQTLEGLAREQARLTLETLRLQEALHQAENATAEFIDFVAHELKQPMTALKGYTQLLVMGLGGELTPLQRQFVDVINANVERMGKLVNDLLEISRLEAGRIQVKLAPVSLGDIVDEALAGTLAELEARHHSLELDIPDDLPPVLADGERLVQALTHLVRNACRYTPDGGHVRLAAGIADGHGVPPGRVSVRIVDSGIGLSPAELLRVGEKFFRADHDLVQQQPGNGLGVCITRHLVALHGGELQVESESGRGSTFAFTLAVAGDPA